MNFDINRLIDSLREDGAKQYKQALLAAQQEATSVKEKMIAEHQKRIDKRLKQYQEEAIFQGKQEIARHKAMNRNEISQLKQTLINQLIDDCKNYFKSLTDEEFVYFVTIALQKHDTDNKPRIEVDPNHYDLVLKHFGRQYQVISNTKIQAGFILNYPSYDVNFEIDKVFDFNHQSYVKRVMSLLFEDKV